MEGTVLIADDDKNLRSVLTQALTRAGAQVRATATLATLWRWLEEGEGDVVLTDVNLADGDALEFLPKMKAKRPDLQFIVMSAQNTVVTALRAGEAGAFDYLAKPFDLREMLQTLRKAQGQSQSQNGNGSAPSVNQDLPLVGRSEAMQNNYRQLSRIIPSDLPVLISGAAGTGKSLVADVIHQFGPRKSRNVVRFHGNESTFDAISSAFERADGGTLILESVDEFFASEQRQIQTLMDQYANRVRVIATTRQNLLETVNSGLFREDLYYRINVLNLTLPELVDRDDDVIELAEHFLAVENSTRPKVLSDKAKDFLRAHHWQGNVSELQMAIKRLMVMTSGDIISVEELSQYLMTSTQSEYQINASGQSFGEIVEQYVRRFIKLHGGASAVSGLYDAVIQEVERPLIEVALETNGGNQIKTAEMLNINRNTLRKKIQVLDISVTKGKKMM